MILLFFLMVITAGGGLVVGNTFLAGLDSGKCFDRTGDRVIIATWMGLLILANFFLVVSLFMPLTMPVALAAALLLVVAVLPYRNRSFIRQLVSASRPSVLVGMAGLMAGVAAYCSQVIVWYDSGLYHFGMIKWLSEFGLVPGLALIHSRFGIVSSWFTLPAAMNHGFLQGRVASLPGAICLLLMLAHGLVAFFHIVRQDGRKYDFFIAAASLLAIPVILVWGMPNSPSPDFPVIAVAIITAWALFVIASRESRENNNLTSSALNITLVPLILAGAGVSLKLSAFPLIAVAGLYYFFRSGFNGKTAVVGGGIVTFFLAPLGAAGILTSGCAFYPASFFCLDLPWSLGGAAAEAESRIIREWARWGEQFAPENAKPLDWIVPWFQSEKVCTVLMVLSLLALFFLTVSQEKRNLRQNSSVMALAITGTAFMFFAAPSWRFGLGYLVILPALMVANHAHVCLAVTEKLKRIKVLKSFAFLGVITGAILVLHVHIIPRPSYRLLDEIIANRYITSNDHPHFNLLYPPRLWNIGSQKVTATGKTFAFENIIVQDRTGNLVYYRPEDSKVCWDSPLPCAPSRLENITLRRPEKGLAGGFEKNNLETKGNK